MAKAKADDVDLQRLTDAMRAARRTLEYFRTERRAAVQQYVGQHYSEGGAHDRVPVNLIALYVQIMVRSLVAKTPRVMLSTFEKQAKPAVHAMEQWANREVEHMHLASTLQRVAVDGLFSVGIAKVALATPADASAAGWNLAAGTPFVERVDLDDFVFDVHARDFREASFVGHRYRCPLSAVKDSKLYKAAARKRIVASDDPDHNAEGDERITTVSRGWEGARDEFEEYVDLWEVYLPRRRLVLTLLADENGVPSPDVEPLREQEWLGPDEGPYHFLCFGLVPGNAMPVAPIMQLMDLHEAANRAFRKLVRQTDRCKDVTFVQGAADADGNRLINANDGDMLRVDNPQAIQPYTSGGPNQAVFAAFTAFKDLFDFMGGNLALLGGRSPQSKTASQDRMLNENASAGVADMQETTAVFVSRVLKALAWYWWHDPFKVMRVEWKVPGVPDAAITRRVTPQQRKQSKWRDLDVRVDPYSMQPATPQTKAAALEQIVVAALGPLMPLLQQQGIALDANAFLRLMAKYKDMPELQEILTLRDPPEVEGGRTGDTEAPGMAPNTTRTYERVSNPGRTEKGNNMNLLNSLLGVDGGGAPRNGQAQPMQIPG